MKHQPSRQPSCSLHSPDHNIPNRLRLLPYTITCPKVGRKCQKPRQRVRIILTLQARSISHSGLEELRNCGFLSITTTRICCSILTQTAPPAGGVSFGDSSVHAQRGGVRLERAPTRSPISRRELRVREDQRLGSSRLGLSQADAQAGTPATLFGRLVRAVGEKYSWHQV